jgi:hypothetical protein
VLMLCPPSLRRSRLLADSIRSYCNLGSSGVGFGLVQLLGFIMTDQPEMHSQPPSVQQPWIHQLAELLAIVVRPENRLAPEPLSMYARRAVCLLTGAIEVSACCGASA